MSTETLRGPERRYSPHLPRYIGLSILLGLLGLNVEYRVNGTLLLRPAYRWTTREIPGLLLEAPDGAYSLSFSGAQLDWRLVRTGPGGQWPDFEVLGYPDVRLTIYRRPDPGPEFSTPGAAPEEFSAAGASGRLVGGGDGPVVAAFPLGSEFILLRFEHRPTPGGPAADANSVDNDIRRITGSFRALR